MEAKCVRGLRTTPKCAYFSNEVNQLFEGAFVSMFKAIQEMGAFNKILTHKALNGVKHRNDAAHIRFEGMSCMLAPRPMRKLVHKRQNQWLGSQASFKSTGP